MIKSTQLLLLQSKIKEISESPFFTSSLNDFAVKLNSVIESLLHSIAKPAVVPLAPRLIGSINSITMFLTGSTTKKIPYEIVYCLEQACLDWTNKRTIITTALSQDINEFYFSSVETKFYQTVSSLFGIDFDCELVQICLPEIYRRKPLFCVPLYHELGHFIDCHLNITQHSFLRTGYNSVLPAGVQSMDQWKSIQTRHRMEYFADLFSAHYIGRSGIDFLNEIAGLNGPSFTHPATSDRVSVIDDFLSGTPSSIVDIFNQTLISKGLPILVPPVSSPSISSSFDNVRPYSIVDNRELHSFINSGWHYLCDSWRCHGHAEWGNLDNNEVERAVNDLVEKSIRNYMVKSKWGSVDEAFK